MARASVLEKVQVSVEVTPGVATAADKRLQLTEVIRPTPEQRKRILLGVGSKYGIAAAKGKEHSVWPIGGQAGYGDLAYLLSAHLIGTGGGSPFTFLPLISAADVITTLSIEAGSAVQAEKAAYCFVSRLQIAASLAEVGISGTIIGRRLTENIAFTTAVPTYIDPTPISEDEWEVWAGTSEGGIALLPGIKECRVDFGEKWVPGFYADISQPSFSNAVEKAPGMFIEVTGVYDSTFADLAADVRSGAVVYLQFRCTGPSSKSLKVTAPCQAMPYTRDSGDEEERGTFRVEPIRQAAFASGTSAVKVELVNAAVAGL